MPPLPLMPPLLLMPPLPLDMGASALQTPSSPVAGAPRDGTTQALLPRLPSISNAPQGLLGTERSLHRYPPRQSLSSSQVAMQNVRAYGEGACLSSSQRGERCAPNSTHSDSSSGQVPGSQLKMVQ